MITHEQKIQRWIYRIDPKRVNEYGQVLSSDVDAAVAESTTVSSSKQEESKKDK